MSGNNNLDNLFLTRPKNISEKNRHISLYFLEASFFFNFSFSVCLKILKCYKHFMNIITFFFENTSTKNDVLKITDVDKILTEVVDTKKYTGH